MLGLLGLFGMGIGAAVDGIDKTSRNVEAKQKWINNPRPNGVYYGDDVWMDWKGELRDIRTNARRSIYKDYTSGDRIMYDEHSRPIRNLTEEERQFKIQELKKTQDPFVTTIKAKPGATSYVEDEKRPLSGDRYIDIYTGDVYVERKMYHDFYDYIYCRMFDMTEEDLDQINQGGRKVYNEKLSKISDTKAKFHKATYYYINPVTGLFVRRSDAAKKSTRRSILKGLSNRDHDYSEQEYEDEIRLLNKAQKIRIQYLLEDKELGDEPLFGVKKAICLDNVQ